MEKNPYEFLNPVTGNGFVGRHGIVDEIYQEISYSNGASYAIIGGRRFGKSSLLLSVQDKLVNNPECNVLPIYIDLNQRFPSPDRFFAHTIKEISSLALPKFRNSNHVRQYTRAFDQDISYQEFVDVIQSLLEKMPPGTRIGLLLDEIDSVLKYDWHEILFDQLRTLVYSSSVKEFVSLVLAGA